MENKLIRVKTIKLLSRFLKILSDEDLLTVPEKNEIIAQLKNLAEKGEQLPKVIPRLIDQREASAMLGIGFSNFKKIEKSGAFTFKRRMIGSAIRYRNVDIIKYIMADSDCEC